MRKTVEIEEVEEGRGVHAAERPVEREGGKREGRLEALRQHHLKNVAGGDVVLRARRPSPCIRPGVVLETTSPFSAMSAGAAAWSSGAVERVDHVDQAVDGAIVGGARGDAAAPAGPA